MQNFAYCPLLPRKQLGANYLHVLTEGREAYIWNHMLLCIYAAIQKNTETHHVPGLFKKSCCLFASFVW